VAATKKLATANIAKTSNNSTHHTVFGKSILEAFMLSKNKILEAFINLVEKSTYLIEDSYSTANVTEKDELKKNSEYAAAKQKLQGICWKTEYHLHFPLI
jgi:hypothetical protein